MNLKKARLSGINPLSYIGVEPLSTASLVVYKRAPTSSDRKNFVIGALWLDETTNYLWFLTDVVSGSATWRRFGEFTDGTSSFVTDSGTATVALGIINFIGATAIETTGSGNSTDTSLTNGTDGQLLIGSTASGAAWANLTSAGGTVTITEGSNTINIEAVGGAGLQTFTADVGVATPAAGVVTFAGGTNMTTAAAASTLTVNLDDNVTLSGTLQLTLLNAGAMQTNSSGEAFSDNGTNGQLLIGGGTEPNWANITSGDGTITITNGPNTINLESSGGIAGEASFLAYQPSNTGGVIELGVTPYYLGSANPALTEVFDVGSNFFVGDAAGSPATFTAPATGKYMLNCYVTYFRLTGAIDQFPKVAEVSIVTSNRKYNHTTWILNSFGSAERQCARITVCADMDASDTASYYIEMSWAGPTTPHHTKLYQIRGKEFIKGSNYYQTAVSGYKVA